MQRALTNLQMREADNYSINVLGISSEVLMRRAGEAVAKQTEIFANDINAESITVVCGTGNNGGDGYVCAEKLKERGFNVKVFACEGIHSPDCLREKNSYSGEYTNEVSADLIVDCIFGTGLSREVSGKYAEIISKINSSGGFVVSADIPSGLNGDNGLIMSVAVKANVTVAIAEYKTGMFLNDGPDFCGKIVKADVGIICPDNNYAEIFGLNDIKEFFPVRKRNSHKGIYGSANLIAGSPKYAGAAALSSEAALKSGCGLVKLTSSASVKNLLVAKFPQVIYCDETDFSAQAIACGMGCGVSFELYSTLKHIIKTYRGVLIVDADGLNALSEFGKEILKTAACSVILTPHIKEFSRLTGKSVEQILSGQISLAREFANEYCVTVMLKSSATVITDGEKIAINITGNSALSKGGSGDMLAGYLCGTVARGVMPFNAAVVSAYVLGRAAEIASEEKTEYCTTAKDVLKNLHFSVKRLTE